MRPLFLSRYGTVFRDPHRPGRSLVFSTLTGSLVRLPTELVEELRAGSASPTDEETAVLREAGVVVEDPGAELVRAREYLQEVNRASTVLVAAVVVGMGCNFACPYCYEGPEKGTSAMDPATLRAVAAYLLSQVDVLGRERLVVDFYGGEPLMYGSRLLSLSEFLSEACSRRGVVFEITLVTNGSLLTPDVVEPLVSVGLKGVKVTVDGPPDVHDRFRPYRDGSGSFHHIVQNLKGCVPLVPVGLSVNITPDTWTRVPDLLDRLASEGLGPGQIAQVTFGPVIGDRRGGCAGCVSASEPWLARAVAALHQEARRRGFAVPDIIPSPCMADLDHAITVNWDGSLTRCPALVNRTEFVVGTVSDGVTTSVDPFRVPRWEHRGECLGCEYLPLCFGGCRYMALLRTGDMAEVDCQRTFWEVVLEARVLEDARAASAGPSLRGTTTP